MICDYIKMAATLVLGDFGVATVMEDVRTITRTSVGTYSQHLYSSHLILLIHIIQSSAKCCHRMCYVHT